MQNYKDLIRYDEPSKSKTKAVVVMFTLVAIQFLHAIPQNW